MYWGCETRGKPAGNAAAPERRRHSTSFAKALILIMAAPLCSTPALSSVVSQTPATMPECEAVTLPGHADTEADTKSADTRIVIIIDDLGPSKRRGHDAIELPGNLTYAVIPFTAHGRELAEAAHDAGKEVMLHAPMSTLEVTPLGEGGLTPELSRKEFHETLAAALDDVPHVRGVNNHMGSDLTRRRQQMAWLMGELRWQELYFVDSRTNKETVAATVAGEFNVPHLSRHVFLDNVRTAEAIGERFAVLLEKAQEEGLAVAIGHPYPETIAFLNEALPLLHEQGIELVAVSEALALGATQDYAAINPQTDSYCCPAC